MTDTATRLRQSFPRQKRSPAKFTANRPLQTGREFGSGVGGERSSLEKSSAAGGGIRMARAGEPSVRRGEQTGGAGGDGDLPGDERPDVEVWRGGRDGHGAAAAAAGNEGRRVGSVGGEEGGEEGMAGDTRWQRWATRRQSFGKRRPHSSPLRVLEWGIRLTVFAYGASTPPAVITRKSGYNPRHL